MAGASEGGKRFGRYVLHERIGLGGMAEIFRASMYGIDGYSKPVAIKRILPHLAEDQDFVDLFVEEAKLTARLVHRHVVQNYELGSVEGVLFMAMEFVDGRDLSQTLLQLRKMRETMPPELAAYIISCICQGLHHAHNQKDSRGRRVCVLHRDVSPSNILMSWEGDVKIGDFGIAKAATSTGSSRNGSIRTGCIRGKFDYMAPEQVKGKVDPRSDIYAAGIVLWEMLVGRRLFRGENEAHVIELICYGTVPRAADLVEIPSSLQQILDSALSPEVDTRFQTADVMADALNDFIYWYGKNAGPRELSVFLRRIFEDHQASAPVDLDPGAVIQGRISRVAAKPRKSTKDGYLFRGLELVETGSDRKVILILPQFAGEDIYSFPLFCREGSVLAAYNLQLNNELADGSVVFIVAAGSDLVLDPTIPSVPACEVDTSGALPRRGATSSQDEVESIVAAAGGTVERSDGSKPREDFDATPPTRSASLRRRKTMPGRPGEGTKAGQRRSRRR
jgi:serine/threonine protein kinase